MLYQFQVYSKVNPLYVYTYPLSFLDSFPCRSLQSIEQSSLCCTVGPYLLSILYIVVCRCQSQSPHPRILKSVGRLSCRKTHNMDVCFLTIRFRSHILGRNSRTSDVRSAHQSWSHGMSVMLSLTTQLKWLLPGLSIIKAYFSFFFFLVISILWSDTVRPCKYPFPQQIFSGFRMHWQKEKTKQKRMHW